jgi:lipid A 3-O-deacylase
MMTVRYITLLSLLMAIPVAAMAEVENASDSNTFSFYLENDAFAGTDRYYTSGIRLTWVSPDLTHFLEHPNLPEWSHPLIERLPFINEPGYQRAIYLSVGQNIFTPEDMKRRELIENDRPYAGLTYLAIGFQSKNNLHMDTLEFDLGIVGPHSYAEDVQTQLHRWIDSPVPMGWDNQLNDELAAGLMYMHKYKLIQSGLGNGFNYDVIPHMGGGVGNLKTYGNAGAQFRFGWNLPNDFGTFLIRPGCECNVPIDERDPRFFPRYHRFGIHGFMAIDAIAVFHDIFLDGNTFQDSHSVDKKPFTADVMAGLSLILSRFKMSYAYVYRTKEFENQQKPNIFGTITISFNY